MAGVPNIKLEHLVNGSWLDVTNRVMWSDSPLQLQRGVSEERGALVGTGVFVLDNSDGALTQKRPASPHYPHLIRYRKVRLSVFIGGAWRPRHYGYLDSEPLTFGNEPATDCRVTWSTIDHFGMAGLKPLRSVAVEATAAKGPLAYWPLTDAEATAAADQSGNSQPGLAAEQYKTGGEIAWSSGVVLPTDNVGGIVFTPSSDAGVYLQSESTIDLPTSWSLTVHITPAAKDGYVCQVGTDSYSIGIWYDTSTKKLHAMETKLDNSGDPIDYALSSTSSTWAGGVETLTVTPTTVKLGSSGTTGTRHSSVRMKGSLVSVGGAFAVESGRQRMYSGEVKHLAIWSGAVPANTASDIVTGPPAMLTTSTAVQRLLQWAGLGTVTVNTLGTDRPVVLQKTESLTAFDVINNLARGQLARIFCAGDGSVTVAAFDYVPSTVTAPSSQIGLGIEWAANYAGDVSDAVMTWPDGSTYTASEPAAYRSQIDLPGVLSPASGRSVADWVVATSTADPAFPVAPFDLLTIPSADVLALLEGGAFLAIPNLPSQLPASSQTGAVETLTETIGAAEWTLQVATSTDARDQLFIVGDPVRGVVGAGYMAAPLGPEISGTGVWKPGMEVDAATLNANSFPGGMMQAGTAQITPTANTPSSVAVTFPNPFPSVPVVVPSADGTAPYTGVREVAVSNITTTGCTLWIYRVNTAATQIHWVAAVN